MGRGAAALAISELPGASESPDKSSRLNDKKHKRDKEKSRKSDKRSKDEKRKKEFEGNDTANDAQLTTKKRKRSDLLNNDDAESNIFSVKKSRPSLGGLEEANGEVDHMEILPEDDMEDTDIGLGQKEDSKQKTSFEVSNFNMSKPTVRALKEKNIESLFEIQGATYNFLRNEKKDVIGRARTGSGKTLAFVLPVVESIVAENMNKTSASNKPLVLCLAPTRELAQQVHRDFEWIGNSHRLSSACFYGGSAKGPQFGALRRGLDVLVGTPGRIIDHLDEGSLSLASVRFVILDEADEMLSMGFQEAVERILSSCPPAEKRQTLLFSATVPRWVKGLARKYMRSDATVTVDTVSNDKNRTNSDITHLAMACPPYTRGDTLADVVKVYTGALGKTLVFTDTKAEANELACHDKLVHALGGAGVLHGDITQANREQTLAAYREGKIRVLVATDVAARGLDIKGVDLVIQTHPPSNYENYIHRSGRTGRAGNSGICVTFYGQREKYLVGLIEHKAGIKLKRVSPPQAKDIIRASVDDTVKKIAMVHPDNLSLFSEVARKILESYPEDDPAAGEKALAASLACMAGYVSEPVKTRSLLSCFEGFVAAMITGSQNFESSGHAWSTFRRFAGADIAAEVKGMTVCKDKRNAVFDIPQKHLKKIEGISSRMSSGFSISIPEELPPLPDDDFDLQSAMQQLNEKRSYRGGRFGGGSRGGSFSAQRRHSFSDSRRSGFGNGQDDAGNGGNRRSNFGGGSGRGGARGGAGRGGFRKSSGFGSSSGSHQRF